MFARTGLRPGKYFQRIKGLYLDIQVDREVDSRQVIGGEILMELTKDCSLEKDTLRLNESKLTLMR